MKPNPWYRLLTYKHFKSLPDGRRVFFADFPWSASYVIPNDRIEHQLYKKTVWTNLCMLISMFLLVGGVWFFSGSIGAYTGSLILVFYFLFAAVIRWTLYRDELRNLQKIDFQLAILSFYNALSENLRSHSRNSFPSHEINTLLDIPSSNDKIVMLKYTGSFSNILRCQLDGSIVWQAELPTASDVYTNVEWKDQKLHAFSRSCQTVLLDKNTGRILLAESNVQKNSA